MSETIAPCPVCGEPGIAISQYHTGCSVCDFVATPDRWSRLSRAAALLRACEVIEAACTAKERAGSTVLDEQFIARELQWGDVQYGPLKHALLALSAQLQEG